MISWRQLKVFAALVAWIIKATAIKDIPWRKLYHFSVFLCTATKTDYFQLF